MRDFNLLAVYFRFHGKMKVHIFAALTLEMYTRTVRIISLTHISREANVREVYKYFDTNFLCLISKIYCR